MMLQPAQGWPGACSPQRRLPQFAKLILSYLELEVRLATLRGLEQPLLGQPQQKIPIRQAELEVQFEALKARAATPKPELLALRSTLLERKKQLLAKLGRSNTVSGIGLAAIDAQLSQVEEWVVLQLLTLEPIAAYAADPEKFRVLLRAFEENQAS